MCANGGGFDEPRRPWGEAAVGLTMAERKAVTKQAARRYERASKSAKSKILDELCELTGWSRGNARRALKGSAGHPWRVRTRPSRLRPRIYDEEVLAPLRLVWATLGGPSGKRLAPFMAEAVQAMCRHGELEVSPEARRKLERVSAATIDRLLASERRRLRVRGRSGTKPGSLLRRQVPIRTFAEWDDAAPGFCEIDLVAHDGGDPRGQFCQTLTATCVATGWTEVRALQNKAQRWVFEALGDVESLLPFPLRGLDSDNGSEFINNQLVSWCAEQQITFTRSRPWRKNDNCFVEQKNWAVVRQAVGYGRYDTPRELAILSELYERLVVYVNFFQPQMKLREKTRQGAKVTRRYDLARTPLQRLLGSGALSPGERRALCSRYAQANPAELKRQIGRLQDDLLELGRRKVKAEPGRKEVRVPLDHPWSRTFSVRQRAKRMRAS